MRLCVPALCGAGPRRGKPALGPQNKSRRKNCQHGRWRELYGPEHAKDPIPICKHPIHHYIILHEGGHALIALSCGARITEFSILGAYMRYEGGTFTALTLSLFYIAGMLLPVLISIAYMLLYRDAAQSVFYRIFSFLFPLILTAPALAWGIVPLLYLSDQAPPGDDVTGFIESSGASPWAVLLGAVLLFAGCLFLAWQRKIIQNYWAAVRLGVS